MNRAEIDSMIKEVTTKSEIAKMIAEAESRIATAKELMNDLQASDQPNYFNASLYLGQAAKELDLISDTVKGLA